MKKQSGYALALFAVWAIVVVAALGGWVANIVKMIGMDFGSITGMLVARVIGVFLAPLGAVLGYL